MSDIVVAAIINGFFTIIAVSLSRLMSMKEHKSTAKDVKNIKDILINNGNG